MVLCPCKHVAPPGIVRGHHFYQLVFPFPGQFTSGLCSVVSLVTSPQISFEGRLSKILNHALLLRNQYVTVLCVFLAGVVANQR